MTQEEILYKNFKRGFFSTFEEMYALQAMEDYKNQSIKTLEGIIEIKEKERKEWAEIAIRKQVLIEQYEARYLPESLT